MGTHLILPRFPPTCCSVSPRLIFPTKIHYSTQTRTLTTPLQAPSLTPRFSPGVDAEALSISLNKLLRGSGGRWILTKDGEAVERNFKFKTFSKTWDFMTAVSLQCKIRNHHPEWSNVYNTTLIRWTTHNPKGLSDKDVHLAAICDALARDFGELVENPSQSKLYERTNVTIDRPSTMMQYYDAQLAGEVAAADGDGSGKRN